MGILTNTDNRTGTRMTGYALAIAQAVFYSTMGIFGKMLYATGLDAQEVVILRYLATTVLLAVVLLVWRKQPPVSRQPSVYVQAVFFCLSSTLYFFAVERMSAGMTTVIFYLFPIVVALINLIAFHERFSWLTAAALALSLVGLALVSGIASGELALDGLGICLGFVSCISFAIYTVLVQRYGRSEGSLTVTFTLSWTGLIATCILFAPSVPSLLSLDYYQIAVGCIMSLANTILPIVLYIEAIKRIGSTSASLISMSETPFSLLFAYLLLGETLSAEQGVGATLIMIGIVVVTCAPLLRKRRAKAHASSASDLTRGEAPPHDGS